ncbi:unnamed protein product [Allacma fusca]|uniref:KxDL domain-containing protein n=1 Tax=Allacma fusca TaxID=39272 RepID=A0A8J2K8D9_9HEXA|nr:unnamed protein product [Allacma fusca]
MKSENVLKNKLKVIIKADTSKMAEMSPLSEGGRSSNVECFQNFTAPEVFVQGLAGMVNQQDVEAIIRSQKYMLQRFEKTNEMLVNCNALSAARFQNAFHDFKKHTQMLAEMKKDMDNVFRRIRNIKAKLANQHPQAFEIASANQRKEKGKEDEDDEDDDVVAESSSVPSSACTSRQVTIEKSESVDIPTKKHLKF